MRQVLRNIIGTLKTKHRHHKRHPHVRNAKLSTGSWLIIGTILIAVPLAVNQVIRYHEDQGVTYAVNTPTLPIISGLPGTWSNMAGTSLESGGLRILDTNFAIVEQDGSGGQPNPPVNLLGTHLSASGNFTLTTQLKEVQGTAGIQLYAQAPVIQDEFRVDGPYLTMNIAGDKFTVSLYDGGYKSGVIVQKPSFTKTYTINNPSSTYTLAMSNNNGQLSFSLNGQNIGSTADRQLLQSGSLWFGATSSDGTWLLSGLSFDPATTAAANNSRSRHHRSHFNSVKSVAKSASTIVGFTDPMNLNTTVATPDPNGLQTLASKKRPGFLIGAAMALSPLASDPQYANVALGGNFGSMTTENALKWQFVEPKQNVFDFHEADAMVALAKQHNMVVHGHNLVFSEALPGWVQDLPVNTPADKTAVKNVMDNHIQNLVSHFKGKIASWDVVNEPLADYDVFSDNNQLRSNKWLSAMGPDYIAEALKTAHAADPSAKLFINDYGLEENGDRWDAMVGMLTVLKNQHVPIDGVGFESHIYEEGDKIDANVLRQHIRQLASMGITARISEMDVYNDDGVSVQTQQYGDVLNACISEPNCVSFTTWGVSDRYDMWSDDGQNWEYGQDFLWADDMKPNPPVARLIQILK